MKKRLISLCLALVMVVSLLPTMAFAVEPISLTVENATVAPGGTTTVDVSISGAGTANLAALGLKFDFDSSLTLDSVDFSQQATEAGFAFGLNNLPSGIVMIDGNVENGSSLSDGVFFTLSFTADETANGTYPISVDYKDNDEEYIANINGEVVPCDFIPGTITVGSVDGYTATIATTQTTVKVDDTVSVKVNVNKEFASSEVKLTYDPTYLQLKGTEDTYADVHTLNGAAITVSNGTIKLVDHGTSQSGTAAYVLNFTALKNTEADQTTPVALTSAGFSTAEEAKQEDLTVASGLNTLAITIEKKEHSVTLNKQGDTDIFTSEQTTVTDGESYTFETNSDYHDYKTVTIKMGDKTVIATLNAEGTYDLTGDTNVITVTESNGAWTVNNVTADLEISGTREGRIYNVTVTDNEHKDKVTYSATAQHGTQYSFTASSDKKDAVGIETGYYYEAATTVGGVEYKSVSGTAATIPGEQITSDFVITVTKKITDATEVSFAISNNTGATVTAKDSDGNAITGTTVKKNSTITVALSDTEYGYTYTVNGAEYEENMELAVGDTAFTLTVERTPITVTGVVYDYLTLNDEQTMWLVAVEADANTRAKLIDEGNVYTYGGKNMFWSSHYNAYCYLVVEATKAEVSTEVSVAEGTAEEIAYDMDVNQSGVVDANDAQLVYDMYQTKAYNTELETGNWMSKFLEADLNGDLDESDATFGIETTDASTIINTRLTANW